MPGKFRPAPFGAAQLSLALVAFLIYGFLPCAAEDQAPHERRFTIEYTATVKEIPANAKEVELWLPVPHDSPFQKIRNFDVVSPYPYEIHTAQYDNRVLHIKLKEPKTTAFTVTMRFEATRIEHINPVIHPAAYKSLPRERKGSDMARWLEPDRLVPLDDKIRGWAQEVVRDAGAKTDLEKARAIYNHIVATVKYDKTGQGWGRGDIYYACDARRGNCTDFHAIFIGYARSLGIPARFAIGLPVPAERGTGQITGYHCWAEFYTRETGWVPVDASEAAKDPSRRDYFFGAHDENRVEFSIGRDLKLNPKQNGDLLNYFIYPYAEVDGKPFTSVDRSFNYRDVPATPASTA